MIDLRPRQQELICNVEAALEERGNTLAVAPTGFGKTVVVAETTRRVLPRIGSRALVIQHRDELVAQNRETFADVTGGAFRTSVMDGTYTDPHGDVIFGMIQSLRGERKLSMLPPLDLIVTDETHHSAAKTYMDLYAHARAVNPKCQFFGVTATARRPDKKPLLGVYDNVADVATLTETIKSGYLVPPVAKVIDLGAQEKLRERRSAADYDSDEVEEIMRAVVPDDAVISHWRQLAGDRSTVIFTSSVSRAMEVAESFRKAGISAATVEGKLNKGERRRILEKFDKGEIQVVTNAYVLTEGWDCGRVSCVVLLRGLSSHSGLIQMVGRGLRLADSARYPGVLKRDCVVIDFGASLITHQTLDQDVDLSPRAGPKRNKTCPKCTTRMPASLMTCPVCGHDFPKVERSAIPAEGSLLGEFAMTEIDIVQASPFRWEQLFGGAAHIAASFSAWTAIVQHDGKWSAVGSGPKTGAILLEHGESMVHAFAAGDDFMRLHGKRGESGKAKEWLASKPTDKQLQMLGLTAPGGLTRYSAMCWITWKFNEGVIKRLVTGSEPGNAKQ